MEGLGREPVLQDKLMLYILKLKLSNAIATLFGNPCSSLPELLAPLRRFGLRWSDVSLPAYSSTTDRINSRYCIDNRDSDLSYQSVKSKNSERHLSGEPTTSDNNW